MVQVSVGDEYGVNFWRLAFKPICSFQSGQNPQFLQALFAFFRQKWGCITDLFIPNDIPKSKKT